MKIIGLRQKIVIAIIAITIAIVPFSLCEKVFAEGETSEAYDLNISKKVLGAKSDQTKDSEFTVSVWRDEYDYVPIWEMTAKQTGSSMPVWSTEITTNTDNDLTVRGFTFSKDAVYYAKERRTTISSGSVHYNESGIEEDLMSNEEYRSLMNNLIDLFDIHADSSGYPGETPSDTALRIAYENIDLGDGPTNYITAHYGKEFPIVIDGREGRLLIPASVNGGEEPFVCYAELPKRNSQQEYMDLSSFGGTDNGNGSYTFTLSHDESLNIRDIPSGYRYEITEKDYSPDHVDTYVDGAEGRTAEGRIISDTSHTFTNLFRYDLTIKKKVAGNGGDHNKAFHFKVRVYGWKDIFTATVGPGYIARNWLTSGRVDWDFSSTQRHIVNPSSNMLSEIKYLAGVEYNGTPTYMLDMLINGESRWTFDSGQGGYSQSEDWFELTGGDGQHYFYPDSIYADSQDLPAMETGDILTMRALNYYDFEKSSFSYAISYDDMWEYDFWQEFTLKDGESLTIPDIPYGYDFEVVEDDYSSEFYTTTVENDRGTVDEGETSVFTNTKNSSDASETTDPSDDPGNDPTEPEVPTDDPGEDPTEPTSFDENPSDSIDDPTEPMTSYSNPTDSGNGKEHSRKVQTGDGRRWTLWLVAMIVAVISLTGVAASRIHRRNSED